MKCPHCKREISPREESPQGLLAHIEITIQSKENEIKTLEKHDHKTERHKNNFKKWYKWREWIKEQLESKICLNPH